MGIHGNHRIAAVKQLGTRDEPYFIIVETVHIVIFCNFKCIVFVFGRSLADFRRVFRLFFFPAVLFSANRKADPFFCYSFFCP